MDFVEMKRSLDDLVERFKAATEKVELPGGICAMASISQSVLVPDGIQIMADVMNIELHEVEHDIDHFKGYEYYFMYRGVKFSHFSRERLKNVSVQ